MDQTPLTRDDFADMQSQAPIKSESEDQRTSTYLPGDPVINNVGTDALENGVENNKSLENNADLSKKHVSVIKDAKKSISNALKDVKKSASESIKDAKESVSESLKKAKQSASESIKESKIAKKSIAQKKISRTLTKLINKIFFTAVYKAGKAKNHKNDLKSTEKHIKYMGKAQGQNWNVECTGDSAGLFKVSIPGEGESGLPFDITFHYYTQGEATSGELRFYQLNEQSLSDMDIAENNNQPQTTERKRASSIDLKSISTTSYTSLIKEAIKANNPEKTLTPEMVEAQLNQLSNESPSIVSNENGTFSVEIQGNAKNPENPEPDSHGDIQFSFRFNPETEEYTISDTPHLNGLSDTSLTKLLQNVIAAKTTPLDRTNATDLCKMLSIKLENEDANIIAHALNYVFTKDPLFNETESNTYAWAQSAFPEESRGLDGFTEPVFIYKHIVGNREYTDGGDDVSNDLDTQAVMFKNKVEIGLSDDDDAKAKKMAGMLRTELGSLIHRKPVSMELRGGGKYIQEQGHITKHSISNEDVFNTECGVLSAKLGTTVDPNDTQNMGYVLKEIPDPDNPDKTKKQFIVGRTSRTDTPKKVDQNSLMQIQTHLKYGLLENTNPTGQPTYTFQRTDVTMMDRNYLKSTLAYSKSTLEGKPPESEVAFLNSKKAAIDNRWNPDLYNDVRIDENDLRGPYIFREMKVLEGEDSHDKTIIIKEYKPIVANLSIGTFVDDSACDRIRHENIPVFKSIFNSKITSAEDQKKLNDLIDDVINDTQSAQGRKPDELSSKLKALKTFLNDKGMHLDTGDMHNLEIALTGKFLGEKVAPEHQAISMALSLYATSKTANISIGCECKSGNDRTQVYTSLALAYEEYKASHDGKGFFYMTASKEERFELLTTFFDSVPKSGHPNLLAARGPSDSNDPKSPPQIKTGTQKVFMKMYNEMEALSKELNKGRVYKSIDDKLMSSLYLNKKVKDRLPNVIRQKTSTRIRSQIESASLNLKGAFAKKDIDHTTIVKHLTKLGKAKNQFWNISYENGTYTVSIPETKAGAVMFTFTKDGNTYTANIKNKKGENISKDSYIDLVNSCIQKKIKQQNVEISKSAGADTVQGSIQDNAREISDFITNLNPNTSIKYNLSESNEITSLNVTIPQSIINKYERKNLAFLEKNNTTTFDISIEDGKFVASFPDIGKSIGSHSLEDLFSKASKLSGTRLDRSDHENQINAIKTQIQSLNKKNSSLVLAKTLQKMRNEHPFFQDPNKYQFIEINGESLLDTLENHLGASPLPEDHSDIKASKKMKAILQIELNSLVRRLPATISMGSGKTTYEQSQGYIHSNSDGLLVFDTKIGPPSSEIGNLTNADDLQNSGIVNATYTDNQGITSTETVIARSSRSDTVYKIDQKSIMEITSQLETGSLGAPKTDENGKEYYSFRRTDISLLDTDEMKSTVTSLYSRARGLPEESELKFLENKANSYDSRWDDTQYSDTKVDKQGRVYVERQIKRQIKQESTYLPGDTSADTSADTSEVITVREYKPISTITVMGSILETKQINELRKKNIDIFKDILTLDFDELDEGNAELTQFHSKDIANAIDIMTENPSKSAQALRTIKATLADYDITVDDNTLTNLEIALTGKHEGVSVSKAIIALSTASAQNSLSKAMGLSVGVECKSGNDRTQVFVSYALASHEFQKNTGESFCWATASSNDHFNFMTYFFESLPDSALTNLLASRGVEDMKGKDGSPRACIKVDTNEIFQQLLNTYKKVAERHAASGLPADMQRYEKTYGRVKDNLYFDRQVKNKYLPPYDEKVTIGANRK